MAAARSGNALAALSVAGIAVGGGLYWAGLPKAASWAWAATTLVALIPLALSTVQLMLKGTFGVDLIALLAMAGALAFNEELAGAVIALMLSGGQTLERFANRRARQELTSLLKRAPNRALRYADGALEDVPLEGVGPGDRLLVRSGDVVPVDGTVEDQIATLDESALTGEAMPVRRPPGSQVQSGVVNAAQPFILRATATAEGSTYAAIVRLVRQGQASRAPFLRLADRYAVFFLPLSVAIAAAGWALSGNPIRALAVLVVATPCPLILAAPVAVVAGISRAARHGVILKGGAALEALAQAKTLLLDKTGTVTSGQPEVASVNSLNAVAPEQLVRLAASLDQVSPHVFAPALVSEAQRRGLRLAVPENVEEEWGAGIRGLVDGTEVALGSVAWVTQGAEPPRRLTETLARAREEGLPVICVAVEGRVAGAITIQDPLRPDAASAVNRLRAAGVKRVVLLTGDHATVAERVGQQIGADEVAADCSPEDKVRRVHEEQSRSSTVMVGDGINDAPALVAARVGVAMGVRGASASSEAADVVIAVDRLDRLADGLLAAQRATAIARQSVVVGMGLSGVAMAFAALGMLAPVPGAFLQEVIDTVVILNALRALRPGRQSASFPADPA